MPTPPLPADEPALLAALRDVAGIVAAEVLRDVDREPLRALEEQAGKQEWMDKATQSIRDAESSTIWLPMAVNARNSPL